MYVLLKHFAICQQGTRGHCCQTKLSSFRKAFHLCAAVLLVYFLIKNCIWICVCVCVCVHLSQACADVRAGPVFWQQMELVDNLTGNPTLPEWLSTHPSHRNRSGQMDRLIPQVE